MQSDNSTIKLSIFEGENYHIWVTRIDAYLDADDLWKAVEIDYVIDPLLETPKFAQIKNHRRENSKNRRQIRIYFLLFMN